MNNLTLNFVALTAKDKKTAIIEFSKKLTLIVGASNSGKSFSLDIVNYMLGSDDLELVTEAEDYEHAWLGFNTKGKDYVLKRKVKSNILELFEAKDIKNCRCVLEQLNTKKASKNAKLFSEFMLSYFSASGRKISKNDSGYKVNVTIGHFREHLLVDEAKIQDKKSLFDVNDKMLRTQNRRFFRWLITNDDDSSIETVLTQNDFGVSKNARLQLLRGMLENINIELIDSEKTTLAYDVNDLEFKIKNVSNQISSLNDNRSELLILKNNKTNELLSLKYKVNDLELDKKRFIKLSDLYKSDINRLNAIEEAAEIISIGNDEICLSCGQERAINTGRFSNCTSIKSSALAEIRKIESLKKDLDEVIKEVSLSQELKKSEMGIVSKEIEDIGLNLGKELPIVEDLILELREFYEIRDKINRSSDLQERKANIETLLNDIQVSKAPGKNKKPVFSFPVKEMDEICKITGELLSCWGFPGVNDVVYQEDKFDICIDGKPRRLNGKGVRSIIHSAFKIAVLLYCKRESLHHPGFLFLDSPLVTYRDPSNEKKGGALEDDELEIRKTLLKDKFYKYLSNLDYVQIIIIENKEPSFDLNDSAIVYDYSDLNDGFIPS